MIYNITFFLIENFMLDEIWMLHYRWTLVNPIFMIAPSRGRLHKNSNYCNRYKYFVKFISIDYSSSQIKPYTYTQIEDQGFKEDYEIYYAELHVEIYYRTAWSINQTKAWNFDHKTHNLKLRTCDWVSYY